MKKLLIVSDKDLYPVNAGNRRRIVDMIDLLRSDGFDVYYLHLNRYVRRYDRRKMEEYLGKGRYYLYKGGKYTWNARLRHYLREEKGYRIYHTLDEAIPSGLLEYIRELQAGIGFDVVISEYVTCSRALTVFDRQVLKIIDTHDICSDRNKIFESLHQKPTGIYMRNAAEIRGLKRADIVFAIQNKEAEIFKHWLNHKSHTKVVMAGNIVKTAPPSMCGNRTVLMVGALYSLNLVSAMWFIDEVLPLLADANIQLTFAGKVCSAIPDSPGYVKLGFVDDLEALYQNTAVVINPILGGTGLNIKTIEALGYSKPLVSTSIGAKGLPHPEKYMRIADTPEEFRDAILELLDNPDEQKRLANRAYRFITKYNEICTERLLRAVNGKG